MVNTTQWKYGKQWVYSTTYDEVVTSTVQNGLPIHEQFGVPGHITVVVGQMGEPRDVQGSGYDATYRHISVEECKLAQRYGWTVSNHSMTHNKLPGSMAVPENARIEVVDAARLLGRAARHPRNHVYCAGERSLPTVCLAAGGGGRVPEYVRRTRSA